MRLVARTLARAGTASQADGYGLGSANALTAVVPWMPMIRVATRHSMKARIAMSTSMFEMGASSPMQSGLAFPQPLAEKYRPLRIADFVGLEKTKRIITKLAANPYPSAWLFLGPSGTGKTTMALALAAEIPAELHHIPAKECSLEAVQEVCRRCHYSPRSEDWKPVRFHLVLKRRTTGSAVEAGCHGVSAEHDLRVHL
jgi:ATPase family protein associated with various cellular activities (AAA)